MGREKQPKRAKRTRAANGEGHIGHSGPGREVNGETIYRNYYYDYSTERVVDGLVIRDRPRYRPHRTKTYLAALHDVEQFKRRHLDGKAGLNAPLPEDLVGCAHALINDKHANGRISDGSLRELRTDVNAIEQFFGRAPAHQCEDPDRWRQLFQQYRTTHSEVSTSGFRYFCNELGRWLAAYNVWTSNPIEVAALTLPRGITSAPKTEARVLPIEEIERFLWATNGHPDQAELLYPLVSASRPGEASAPKVADFDWVRGIVRIDKQLDGAGDPIDVKEGEDGRRLLKLPAVYFRILLKHKQVLEVTLGRTLQPDEPLFGTLRSDGSGLLRAWTEGERLGRLRAFQKERGLVETDMYTQRHSLKTIAAYLGLEDLIPRYMGHKEVSTTSGYGRNRIVISMARPTRWRVTGTVKFIAGVLDAYLSILIGADFGPQPSEIPDSVIDQLEVVVDGLTERRTA